jgi:peptidoglycan/LPS O-acetylase OafA/YrhL
MQIQRPINQTASVHLDALRGLAAFFVMLSHGHNLLILLHVSPSAWTTFLIALCSLGHSWVIVFFVLSGYFVGGSVLRSRAEGRWSWKNYLSKRLIRLYVVLIPALILAAILDGIGIFGACPGQVYPGLQNLRAYPYDIRPNYTALIFLENLFYVQHLRFSVFGSNSVLWSLANEFWYYLMFPLLLNVVDRKRKPGVRIALFGVFLLWCWFVRLANVLLFLPWLLGAAIEVLPTWRPRAAWARRGALSAALLLFALVIVPIGYSNASGQPGRLVLGGNIRSVPNSDLVLAIVIAGLVWLTLHCAEGSLPKLYQWLARRSAASSYTLYLVHAPALLLIKVLIVRKQAPAWLTSEWAGWMLFLSVLLYAQVVYECFEKHTSSVRRWVEDRTGFRKVRSVAVSS